MSDHRVMRVWRNRQRSQRAQRIGDVLRSSGIRRLLENSSLEAKIREMWSDLVPAELHADSEAVRLKNGVLSVAAADPSQRYLLETVYKEQLLDNVRTAVGGQVRAIRVVAHAPAAD
jgi:hypothetical protein